MATERDLIDAVRESLKDDGKLGSIKAQLYNDVIELLNNSNKGNKTKLPKPFQHVQILNELIREYLDWMGYKYSSTVFVAECDLSKQPFSRPLLLESLNVKESDSSENLPLLCNLVETYKNL